MSLYYIILYYIILCHISVCQFIYICSLSCVSTCISSHVPLCHVMCQRCRVLLYAETCVRKNCATCPILTLYTSSVSVPSCISLYLDTCRCTRRLLYPVMYLCLVSYYCILSLVGVYPLVHPITPQCPSVPPVTSRDSVIKAPPTVKNL